MAGCFQTHCSESVLIQDNIAFFLIEREVAQQLQVSLKYTSALELFQSDFQPGHEMEMALVTLRDDLCRQLEWGRLALLLLLDLTAAFSTIDCDFLIHCLTQRRGMWGSLAVACPISPGSGTEDGTGREGVIPTSFGVWGLPRSNPVCYIV